MPLPASWTAVPITGTYTYRNGDPLAGKSLSFTSAQVVVIGGETIVPKVIKVRFGDGGSIPAGFTIPSTNDPDLNVTGWAYTVTENWPGGREFDIFVPFDSATLDMATVSPAVSPADLVSIEAAAMATAVGVAAQASADAAATSSTAASTSATNAANSASAAATSETNAATSATNAGTSANAAATSETNAANSATIAADSASKLVVEYGVVLAADAGVVSGGYPAARSVPRAQTMSRFYAEVIAGTSAEVSVMVNGLIVYGPVTVTTTHQAALSLALAAGDEINFDCTFTSVTRFWAQIDGVPA